jgi:outer membrane murein-binding lipoprotein Lpp
LLPRDLGNLVIEFTGCLESDAARWRALRAEMWAVIRQHRLFVLAFLYFTLCVWKVVRLYYRADIDALHTDIDALHTVIDALRADNDALHTYIDTLRTYIDSLRADFDALRADASPHPP